MFFFRLDANSKIGLGHLKRCLVLADELKKSGVTCYFLTFASDLASVSTLIIKHQHQHYILDNEVIGQQTSDALICLKFIQSQVGTKKCCILILDHYDLGTEWEEIFLKNFKLLVFDDFGQRKTKADFILNFSPNEDDNLSKTGKNLVGVQYALISENYLQKKITSFEIRKSRTQLKRLIISFGGADGHNMTYFSLQTALNALPGIEIHCTAKKTFKLFHELQELSDKDSRIHLYPNLEDLSDLCVEADLAIGAGGISLLEKCCLGLPTIVIQTADNQNKNLEFLIKKECIIYAGNFQSVTRSSLEGVLLYYLNHFHELNKISQNSFHLIDGKGAIRVADFLVANLPQ